MYCKRSEENSVEIKKFCIFIRPHQPTLNDEEGRERRTKVTSRDLPEAGGEAEPWRLFQHEGMKSPWLISRGIAQEAHECYAPSHNMKMKTQNNTMSRRSEGSLVVIGPTYDPTDTSGEAAWHGNYDYNASQVEAPHTTPLANSGEARMRLAEKC